MSRAALKEWTEILTPWVQIVGLLAAGIFALVEYRSRQDEANIQRTLDYLSRGDSERLVEARNKLYAQKHGMAEPLRTLLLNQTISQDQRNTGYFNFVINDLVRHGVEDGLTVEFHLVLSFLEEGIVCAEVGLCDEDVLRANLGDFGRNFARTYTPYLCYLRHIWNDPSIGMRAEQFYNSTATGGVCEAYKSSAQAVLQTAG